MHEGEYKSKIIHMIRKEEANVQGKNTCQTDAVVVDVILVFQEMKKTLRGQEDKKYISPFGPSVYL